MMDFVRDVMEQYNVSAKNMFVFKDGYIVSAPEGRYFIKKVEYSIDRVLFIHAAKEHLCSRGFQEIDRFLCTTAGEPFVTVNQHTYTVTHYMEGRECNFDNREDIARASRLLGTFHKAANGFHVTDPQLARDDLGNMLPTFQKRLDELRKLKKLAKKGRNKFDYLYLECVDFFCQQGDEAIADLISSGYESLVQRARSEGIICHHDFTHHNILCSDTGICLINFDYCCLELKIYDIVNYIRRRMRKCSWNVQDARFLLDRYREVEPISEEEMEVMRIMLKFPQKFWRVANKYYNSKRSWSEKSYVYKLQEVIDEIEFHKEFMQQYEKLYEKSQG